MANILTVAGISTMIQGICQFILCALGVSHYFCFINFLREAPLLIFIRILYFANPQCSATINIGNSIAELPNQAMVLLGGRAPDPTYRTFMVNAVFLGFSVLMIVTGAVMLSGGARQSSSVHVRWPWILITLVTIIGDVSVASLYIGDVFSTRTLSELVDYVGATLSAAGTTQVDTSMASILVTLLYGRFGFIIFLNVYLMIAVVFECGRVLAKKKNNEMLAQIIKATDKESASPSPNPSESEQGGARIPRVTVFRRLPHWLMRARAQAGNSPRDVEEPSPRFENKLWEQRRRLEGAVVDTAGRFPPAASQSLPHLPEVASIAETHVTHVDSRGRRGTAAELQGQLPWSYIPPSAHRMRDQLPPDEELPPVPVPDYTLHPKYRKASVHRAGSTASQQIAFKGSAGKTIQPDVLY